MPIFRFDAKLGTKVPLVQGDDISNGAISYGKLDEELKKRLEEIANGSAGGGNSANANLYVSELDLTEHIAEHINGEKPSRYRVVKKVGKLNVPVGVLEVFSDDGQHQLTEILSTNYVPDADGKLTFSSHRDKYLRTYHRFYIPQTAGGVVYIERGTWTDWIAGTDDLINERIESKVDKNDRITDEDIDGIDFGGGGGSHGGGGTGGNCNCDLSAYLKKTEAAAIYPTRDEVDSKVDECVKVVDRITDKDIDDIDLSGGGTSGGGGTGGNTGGNCNCDMTAYLKKTEAADTYMSRTEAENTYAKKSDIADLPTTTVNTKIQVEDIDLTDEIMEYLKGEKPSRLTIVRKVGRLDVPVGTLDVFSDDMRHQLTEVVSTNYVFSYDESGKIVLDFSTHRDAYLYTCHRFYNFNMPNSKQPQNTWSDWAIGSDDIIPEAIDNISNTVGKLSDKIDKAVMQDDRITDSDIEGLDLSGGSSSGSGSTGGGGSTTALELRVASLEKAVAGKVNTADNISAGEISNIIGN